MALVHYLFEAGPQGGPVNNANSGSIANSLTNGSTTTYDGAMAAHGAFGMRVNCQPASQAFRRYTFGGGVGATNWATSLVVTLPASAPGNTVTLASFANATDANRLQVRLLANGSFELSDTGDAHFGVIATGLTWGAKYRISLVVTGGSTTNGGVSAKVYSGTSSWTTQVGSTYSASNWNLGADQVNRVNVGVTANSAAAVVIGIDDLQLDDGRLTEVSDYSNANAAPSADAGVHQLVLPGATVQLDGLASSDPDSGDTLTYAWSLLWPTTGAPTLTGAATATPSFTAGADGAIYALQLEVSDGTDTDIAIVNVAVNTLTNDAGHNLVWTGSAWA